MTTSALVRDARPDDLAAVGLLAAQLVRQHHEFDPQRFLQREGVEKGYQRFLAGELQSPEAVVLVAELDGAVMGYCYGRLEPRSWTELLDACGKLHDLLVDERARGKGLGTLLVRAMVARLGERGAPRVVLSSAWPNESAQKLFRKLGFRPTMVEMTREADPV